MVRLVIKRDSESAIKRGAVITPAHLRPEVWCMVTAMMVTAPADVKQFWITEGWRPAKNKRDLHTEYRAFDFGTSTIPARSWTHRKDIANEWAGRALVELGRDYEIIVHGEADNLHFHAELDPR